MRRKCSLYLASEYIKHWWTSNRMRHFHWKCVLASAPTATATAPVALPTRAHTLTRIHAYMHKCVRVLHLDAGYVTSLLLSAFFFQLPRKQLAQHKIRCFVFDDLLFLGFSFNLSSSATRAIDRTHTTHETHSGWKCVAREACHRH